jgi:hypothetical protein
MSANAHPQLDIFADSRDVMLRNDAIEALLRRDTHAATAALRALAEFEPKHEALVSLGVLAAALTPAPGTAFANLAEASAARHAMAISIVPAAQAVLRAEATGWLAPLWRVLAERAAALPFRADAAETAEAHAAPLWLLAGEPAAAAQAVERIESWRRIPTALAWMSQARHAIYGLDAVWPLLAELAWLAPARFSQCARALADPLLDRLMRRCETECEFDVDHITDLLAWFPAWLLNDQPALLPRLRQAEPGLGSEAERAFRLMGELLGLERQGRHADLIEGRKRLRGLQPALYAVYMRTR